MGKPRYSKDDAHGWLLSREEMQMDPRFAWLLTFALPRSHDVIHPSTSQLPHQGSACLFISRCHLYPTHYHHRGAGPGKWTGGCQHAKVHATFEIQTGAYALLITQSDHAASLIEPLQRHPSSPRIKSGSPHTTFLIIPLLMCQGHSGFLGFLDYASPLWPWVLLAQV